MDTQSSRKVHLIANQRSGKGAGASLPEIAQKVASEVGVELILHRPEGPPDFELKIDEAVAAAKKDGGTVIGAGGDGTIRAVAQKAAEAGVTFAAVPCGTFNFFARNHKLPEDWEEAFRLAMTGQARPVQLGKINDRFFLVNASLGLYAKSIQEREASTRRFGRDRLVVIASTIKSLLSRHRQLHAELVTGADRMRVRTLSIFIGNNALQLRDLAFDVARCMKMNLLAVVVLKPVTRWEMMRILGRGVAKTLENEERLESFCVDSLKIELPQKFITVALDGEMFRMTSPLEVRSVPDALQMVLPPKAKP